MLIHSRANNFGTAKHLPLHGLIFPALLPPPRIIGKEWRFYQETATLLINPSGLGEIYRFHFYITLAIYLSNTGIFSSLYSSIGLKAPLPVIVSILKHLRTAHSLVKWKVYGIFLWNTFIVLCCPQANTTAEPKHLSMFQLIFLVISFLEDRIQHTGERYYIVPSSYGINNE